MAEYAGRGWRVFLTLDPVYVSARAGRELGWWPRYDFRSPLARAVGSKGYHPRQVRGDGAA